MTFFVRFIQHCYSYISGQFSGILDGLKSEVEIIQNFAEYTSDLRAPHL